MYLRLEAEGRSDEEIRNTVKENDDLVSNAIGQVIMWQSKLRVCDFIIIRHAYPNCPVLPARLSVGGNFIL